MNWPLGIVCLYFVLILTIAIIVMYFIPKIISFLLEPKSGSMMDEEKSPNKSSEKVKSDKVRVKIDSPTAYHSREPFREKESLLSRLNPLSRKEKCKECGTELEYREEYQSHYCPKCRTYK